MYDSVANFSQDFLILGVLKAIAPTKGGVISESFSLSKSPNKGANSLKFSLIMHSGQESDLVPLFGGLSQSEKKNSEIKPPLPSIPYHFQLDQWR